jgi:3-deoxy-D-arabino-heptulosonate 7-phosphate (DAHP) synthase
MEEAIETGSLQLDCLEIGTNRMYEFQLLKGVYAAPKIL